MRIVIPSVNYADFLAITLPAWRKLLPAEDFLVVTTPEDAETRAVAAANETGVVLTDVWYQDGATFNKARALDLAFGFDRDPPWRVADGEWCLCLDADVYPFGKLALPDDDGERILYSVHRYACPDPESFRAHRAGELELDAFELIRMWRRRMPDPAGMQGYFQLWRYRPGDHFGSYPSAAKYDVHFARQFPRRKYLDRPYVLHLGEHRRNWSGRITPRWPSAGETISAKMEGPADA